MTLNKDILLPFSLVFRKLYGKTALIARKGGDGRNPLIFFKSEGVFFG